MTEGMHSQIEISGIIESPEQFDKDVFERILNLMTTSVQASLAQFDQQNWASAFNAKDLSPDEISIELK